jgi:hypothetical protein
VKAKMDLTGMNTEGGATGGRNVNARPGAGARGDTTKTKTGPNVIYQPNSPYMRAI